MDSPLVLFAAANYNVNITARNVHCTEPRSVLLAPVNTTDEMQFLVRTASRKCCCRSRPPPRVALESRALPGQAYLAACRWLCSTCRYLVSEPELPLVRLKICSVGKYVIPRCERADNFNAPRHAYAIYAALISRR